MDFHSDLRCRIACILAALLLLGCAGGGNTRNPVPDDELAGMDLHPKPAVLSNTPHTGPYAVGKSLSYTAELQALDRRQ